MRIQNKISIIISLVLLVQALLIIYFFNSSSHTLINKTHQKLFKMSEDYSDELDNRLDNYKKSLKILTLAFSKTSPDIPFIKTYHANYPEFKLILQSSLDGKFLRTFPAINRNNNTNLSHLPYWSKNLSGNNISMSDATKIFGFPAIILSSPVYLNPKQLSENKPHSILSVVIPLDEVFYFSQNLLIEEKAHIIIMNKKGLILHHPRANYILNKTFSGLSDDKALQKIQTAMTSLTDDKLAWGIYHLMGKKHFISFTKNSQKDWIISVSGVLEYFSRDVHELGRWVFFFLVLGFIGSVFIIYFLIQNLITKNVNILKEAMQKVRDGILGQKVHINTKDEMGQLGSSFNYMSEHLKASQARQKESEEQFKRLTECVPEGIIIHNNGKLIDGNQTLSNILGYSLSELIGKNVL
ncbi:MAG: HAMP domain-containing protein, partial [Spirochaetota bacterium]|nr:HAMP domain-containing protein [Spirochaetota bacterium]